MNPVTRSRLFTAAAYLAAVLHSAAIAFACRAAGIAWIALMVAVIAVAMLVRFGWWLHTYPDGDS